MTRREKKQEKGKEDREQDTTRRGERGLSPTWVSAALLGYCSDRFDEYLIRKKMKERVGKKSVVLRKPFFKKVRAEITQTSPRRRKTRERKKAERRARPDWGAVFAKTQETMKGEVDVPTDGRR